MNIFEELNKYFEDIETNYPRPGKVVKKIIYAIFALLMIAWIIAMWIVHARLIHWINSLFAQ